MYICIVEIIKNKKMAVRTTQQFQLSNEEFDKLYELAGLPKEVSKSVALRTVIINYTDLIVRYNALTAQLAQLSK